MTIHEIRGIDPMKVVASVDGIPARIALDLARDGRVLRFEATIEGDGALTRRMLCAVNVGEIQRAVRAEWEDAAHARMQTLRKAEAQGHTFGPDTLLGRLARDARRVAEDLETERPRQRSDAERRWAEIAQLYVRALVEPDPVRAVAAALPGETPQSIRNVLYKARKRGLLTPVGQGRAGGELTDKARRLLDGNR